MKKLFVLLVVFVVLAMPVSVYAADDYGADGLYDNLPDDAKSSLSSIGIDKFDINSLKDISVDSILSEILNSVAEQSKSPLRVLSVITAVLLLNSLLYGIKSSYDNSSLHQALSLCITLCVTGAVVIPIIEVVNSSIEAIKTVSGFMLAYIPVIAVIMTASGQAVSGQSYYVMINIAGQAVSRISADIISPLLKLFLGLSISSAVASNVSLSGLIRFISRTSKWILGFIFGIFTAVLSFRQVISSGLDNVGSKAMRFTISSLVPVVGSALSEAYRTVQGSLGLLKSGVGVFAVIAVIVMFAPVLCRCVLWMFVIWASKTLGELFGIRDVCVLLESVGEVVSVIFAMLLCVMSVFIISTASVLVLGGAG
ncbi:MAG: hypothetical protein VZR54_04040 [Ruminococcus sp.]|nr:hypothetical protein [Ruminococcus sp.]